MTRALIVNGGRRERVTSAVTGGTVPASRPRQNLAGFAGPAVGGHPARGRLAGGRARGGLPAESVPLVARRYIDLCRVTAMGCRRTG